MNRLTGWLVLICGMALATAGFYAIWQGSDIIQAERGWAQVIAGAACLAGGVVTMALAMVLFKLEGVRRAIVAGLKPAKRVQTTPGPAAGPVPELPVAVPVEFRPPEHETVARTDPPAVASPPPQVSSTLVLAGAGAAGLAGVAVAAAMRGHGPESEVRNAPPVPVEAEFDWPDIAAPPAAEFEAHAVSHAIATELDLPEEPEHAGPAAAEPEPTLFHDPVEMPATQPAAVPPAVAELPSDQALPPLDDSWLDRALAGEDEHGNGDRHRPPPASPVAADPESVPPPEPLRANVVARYEAAGVAYAMYDDGSIESDDGEMIRRFKTMADLKAHIAGAA